MSTVILDSWGMEVELTDEHGVPVLLELLDSYGWPYDEVDLGEWLEVEPATAVRPRRREVSAYNEVLRIELNRTVRRYDMEAVPWRGWVRHYPDAEHCPGCEPGYGEPIPLPDVRGPVDRAELVEINIPKRTAGLRRLYEIRLAEMIEVGVVLDAVWVCVPWCWPAPVTVPQVELEQLVLA